MAELRHKTLTHVSNTCQQAPDELELYFICKSKDISLLLLSPCLSYFYQVYRKISTFSMRTELIIPCSTISQSYGSNFASHFTCPLQHWPNKSILRAMCVSFVCRNLILIKLLGIFGKLEKPSPTVPRLRSFHEVFMKSFPDHVF